MPHPKEYRLSVSRRVRSWSWPPMNRNPSRRSVKTRRSDVGWADARLSAADTRMCPTNSQGDVADAGTGRPDGPAEHASPDGQRRSAGKLLLRDHLFEDRLGRRSEELTQPTDGCHNEIHDGELDSEWQRERSTDRQKGAHQHGPERIHDAHRPLFGPAVHKHASEWADQECRERGGQHHAADSKGGRALVLEQRADP